MLNAETKKIINSARDVLVGKIPDPKAQVEQITFAMFYKFMDEKDNEAVSLGGKRQFFTGEFENFSWSKLMDPRLGGTERMDLYTQALAKMSQNPHIAQLFRDIYKDAFIPFRSPETLSLFLKEIDQLDYTNTESLGDAFEYLLSVMGSQGDAGQFRTPRHIIDFIVDVVDPQKSDTILDPACGTAGFLISSYKHIVKQHDGKDDPDNKETPLTPDEKKDLMRNLMGYDISPDMVRLSKVNLYLHGLPNPTIYEYDTLSSEEKWDENFDVILANPPFMSPKGGIKPHKRFSIQANRAEVLFVDYIIEHLKPNGRAGIIVPEGIIFQSSNAYKDLRKKLIEDGLYCVASLPSGVFNPYAGVKTSILFFDKEISKRSNHILFVKINSDGFDLGAQRRPSINNDIPLAVEAINKYQKHVKNNAKLSIGGWPEEGENIDTYPNLQFVSKEEILASNDYNLSFDRYVVEKVREDNKWPVVSLGNKDLFQIESGGTPDSTNRQYWDGDVYWATLADLPQEERITILNDTKRKITELGLKKSSAKVLPINSVIVSSRATIGRIAITKVPSATNQGFKNIIIKDLKKVNPVYLANILTQKIDEMKNLSSGGTFKEISKTNFSTIKITLPPINIQDEIVEEIENYQKIVDGAKKVVSNWKPKVDIDSKWDKVKLKDICDFENGDRGVNYPSKLHRVNLGIAFINAGHLTDQGIDMDNMDYISKERFDLLSGGKVKPDDILFCLRGSLGKYAKVENIQEGAIASSLVIIRSKGRILVDFLMAYLGSKLFSDMISGSKNGVAQPNLSVSSVRNFEIPLPSLEIQKQIVEKIGNERLLVEANKKLIDIYEGKITDVLNEI